MRSPIAASKIKANTQLQQVLEDLARAKGNLAYIKAKNGAAGFANRLAQNKHLYFMGCGDAVKIGISSDPDARMEVLQTGAPGGMTLLATIPNSGHLEATCHNRLAHLQISGEWYRHTFEVDALIRELSL